MTSKQQELKALEKIKAMVAELGEDSYIATAFEGCFEIAEENIENDFACSMKQRAESAEQRAAVAEARAEAAETYLKDARDARDEWHKTANEVRAKWNEAENKLADLQEKHEEENTEEVGALLESIATLDAKAADMKKQLDAKDLEIMKLKAKLYDLQNA